MRNWVHHPWVLTLVCMFYAVWAVLFHQLVLTAWTLQYSYFGVIGILVATGLLYVAYPANERKAVLSFTAFSLLAGIGLSTLLSQSAAWKAVDYVLYLALATLLGRLVLRMRYVRILAVLVSLTALEIWFPFLNMPLLSAFSVRADVHPVPTSTFWSTLPVANLGQTVTSSSPTFVTLATQSPSEPETKHDLLAIADALPQSSVQVANQLLAQSLDVALLKPSSTGYTIRVAPPTALHSIPPTDLGLTNFPLFTTLAIKNSGDVRLYETLSSSPTELLSMLLQPDTLPLTTTRMALDSLQNTETSWQIATGNAVTSPDTQNGITLHNGLLEGHYAGHVVALPTSGVFIAGIAHLLPKAVAQSPEVIVEGNNLLQVITLPPDKVRIVATLRGSYTHPLSGPILFADLTGSGVTSLLLNTDPAQIVQVSSSGHWHVLWVSNQTGFQFAATYPQAQGDMLIANSPALYSTSKDLYLGGYVYRNHQLTRIFRVYRDNLSQIMAVQVAHQKYPDVVASVSGDSSILVLTPSNFPLLALLDSLFGVIVLTGFTRRFIRRKTV